MLIGLVPLLTLAWLDIQTLGALGASLAEELAVSLTEQARANLGADTPRSGEQIQDIIAQAYQSPTAVVERLKKLQHSQ